MAIQNKHLAARGGAAAGASRGRWRGAVAGASALLAGAMGMVWSVVVVRLPAAGFDYSINQLFLLAALPALSAATLRLFYAVLMPVFGGRKWTALSTAALLVPALGIGSALQDPATGYPTMLALALLCGVGGANLAGLGARDRDAGLGALGVPLAQLVAPLAASAAVFGAAGGPAQRWIEAGAARQAWLQNAGTVWVLPILACALCAWFGMREPAAARASFTEQAIVFKRRHTWIMAWLCTGALGSFLGYAAGFPLLLKTEFPAVDAFGWAFVGPLAGVLAGAAGAALAARLGAARVAFGAFCLMAGAVLGVLRWLPQGGAGGSFAGLFGMFVLLFAGTGLASAATARMIVPLFGAAEGAAVSGFTTALAAYGAFFIPKSYGTSIVLTGSPAHALWWCAGFHASCIVITWYYYLLPHPTPGSDQLV
ncbi:MAG: nitrate/nitrite transporter [Pseudomonadota bacterium]|nr:nitrate/nitrite transporter [Pseudomonadota bacterium]